MEEQIHIFDTTLKDGEQCPGAAMTVEQKIQVAMQLEALGYAVPETEMPRLFKLFKQRGDRCKFVYDDDLTAMVRAIHA